VDVDVEVGADQSSVRVRRGDRVVVRLEQPVTGHVWTVTAGGGLTVVDDVLRSAGSGAPGAAAHRVVTVAAEGSGNVVAELKRPWEAQAGGHREVAVVVDESP
jgi:predicted secreted protein